MKRKQFWFILFLIIITLQQSVKAQHTLSDVAEISLMTTAPWAGAVYAVYGHTALYVEDDSLEIDAVFNYGFFDMSQPYFMYHFIKGKTDYILGVQSFDNFINSYGYKGVEVVKQKLNLSQEEKQQLWEALYINHLPENREYRYNYFYDNCVTRPRDLIEIYTTGEIIYPDDIKVQSYRDLIHECVGGFPWMKFGIDLIIGSEADKPISLREKMFLPAYLMHVLDETDILKQNDSGSYKEPIVASKNIVLEGVITTNKKSEWHFTSPVFIFFALFLLGIFVSYLQLKEKSDNLFVISFDTVVFLTAGIGGVIIFFLMFFSEHPATSINWNFIWMNILALIFAPVFGIKTLKQVVIRYHLINFVLLSIFLVFWWLIPQQLPLASIPLSLTLWVRSGSHLWQWKNEQKVPLLN